MNTNNRNPWDGRRPSKDRWWESDENEDEYEMPDTKSTSPTAIQNTKQWIEKPPNENTVVKNCKVRTVQNPQVNERFFFIVYLQAYYHGAIMWVPWKFAKMFLRKLIILSKPFLS